MSFVGITGGITGEDVRDLMVGAVKHRFGPVSQLPSTIEWLTDKGSCCFAHEPRRSAKDIGLTPRPRPWRARKAIMWLRRLYRGL